MNNKKGKRHVHQPLMGTLSGGKYGSSSANLGNFTEDILTHLCSEKGQNISIATCRKISSEPLYNITSCQKYGCSSPGRVCKDCLQAEEVKLGRKVVNASTGLCQLHTDRTEKARRNSFRKAPESLPEIDEQLKDEQPEPEEKEIPIDSTSTVSEVDVPVSDPETEEGSALETDEPQEDEQPEDEDAVDSDDSTDESEKSEIESTSPEDISVFPDETDPEFQPTTVEVEDETGDIPAFSDFLAERLEELGLDVQALAEKSGLGVDCLQCLENGKPTSFTFGMARVLIKALQLDKEGIETFIISASKSKVIDTAQKNRLADLIFTTLG